MRNHRARRIRWSPDHKHMQAKNTHLHQQFEATLENHAIERRDDVFRRRPLLRILVPAARDQVLERRRHALACVARGKCRPIAVLRWHLLDVLAQRVGVRQLTSEQVPAKARA